jgi:hypothetical protein
MRAVDGPKAPFSYFWICRRIFSGFPARRGGGNGVGPAARYAVSAGRRALAGRLLAVFVATELLVLAMKRYLS